MGEILNILFTHHVPEPKQRLCRYYGWDLRVKQTCGIIDGYQHAKGQ
jgi:hypothetical protein